MGEALGWLWAWLLGLAMGLLSGMGLGGGKLLVPLLVLLVGVRQQSAQAVSLLAFVPVALGASLIHARGGRVDVRLVLSMTPLLLAGAAVGAWVANQVGATPLRRAYGLLLLAVAAHELWPLACRGAGWIRLRWASRA